MAALFVLMMLGLANLMAGKRGAGEPAIRIDGERIRIDRPDLGRPAIFRGILGMMERLTGKKMVGPTRRDESLPRASIEQIRVDTYTSRQGGAPVYHDRLLIEGDQGRLEFIGTQFDRSKLEWVRDYLRFTLAGGA